MSVIVLNVVMLSVTAPLFECCNHFGLTLYLSIIVLSVVMVRVAMLSVVVLNVLAPTKHE